MRPTPYCHQTSDVARLLLFVSILLLFVLLSTPILEALALEPAYTLSPIGLTNCLRILLIDNASDHKGQHKDPDVTTLHALPPASFDTNLPEAVDAGASAVQEETTAVLSLNKSPETGEETAEEDTLGR